MKLFLFLIIYHLKTPLSIDFVLLYEKQVEITVKDTYRIYLQQLVKSINRAIQSKNIDIKLDHIYSQSEYVNMCKFDELSRFAGSDSISKRMSALNETGIKNYILAISTGSDEDMKKYQIVTPCKINYVLNLESDENFDRDLLSNLLYGILDVFTKLFGFNVPNLLDMNDQRNRDDFINNISNSDIEDKFRMCIRDDIEKNEPKNYKSSLKENDLFVSEFEKLSEYLNKNKENYEKLIKSGDKDKKPDEEPNEKKEGNPKDVKKEPKIDLNGDTKFILNHILTKLDNMEKEISGIQNKQNDRHTDMNYNDHFTRRASNRPFSKRMFGNFENEKVSNFVNTDKVKLTPFNFKKNPTDITDLKMVK